MRTNAYARLSWFPSVLLSEIASFIHREGPKVVFIEGAATKNQEADVLATSGPVRNRVFFPDKAVLKSHQAKPPTLDVSRYHLIYRQGSYHIGFCNKDNQGKLTYRTKALYGKSPLLRYITQYPFILEKGFFHDRELIKYMEEEITAAGGLRFDWLQHFKQLTTLSELGEQASFKEIIRRKLLKEVHHRLSFCELDLARALYELDPEIAACGYRMDVQSCAPERRFLKTTLLEKMLMTGFWHGWKMIVDVIKKSDRLTPEQRTALWQDLSNQLKGLTQVPNETELDSLLHNGLRILDADVLNNNPNERKQLEALVVTRHAAHLIIQTAEEDGQRRVNTCELGYCDPKTNDYTKYELPINSPLFAEALRFYEQLQNANDGHNRRHRHFVTRAHNDLTLVRKILEQELNVPTRLIQTRSTLDFDSIMNALDNRIAHLKGYDWSEERFHEDWHVTISTLLRCFPGHVWRLWMSSKFPSAINESAMLTYVQSEAFHLLEKNFYGEGLFPLSAFLGDKCYALQRGGMPEWRVGLTFFKIYHESSASEQDELKQCLAGQPEPDEQSSCRLM